MRLRTSRDSLKTSYPGNGNASTTRRHKTGEDSHCRCFSCAVGTEETDDLSLVYLEGDVLECLEGTIVFGDILDFNHFSLSVISYRLSVKEGLVAVTFLSENP